MQPLQGVKNKHSVKNMQLLQGVKYTVWIPCNYYRVLNAHSVNTLFCIQEQFYKNKSLDFGKKITSKLRTNPGLLSHRI